MLTNILLGIWQDEVVRIRVIRYHLHPPDLQGIFLHKTEELVHINDKLKQLFTILKSKNNEGTDQFEEVLSPKTVTNMTLHLWTIFSLHSWVVRRPINTNPVLNVDHGFNFSCVKVYLLLDALWALRFVNVKTEGQKMCSAKFTEKFKTEMKICVNPGLA